MASSASSLPSAGQLRHVARLDQGGVASVPDLRDREAQPQGRRLNEAALRARDGEYRTLSFDHDVTDR